MKEEILVEWNPWWTGSYERDCSPRAAWDNISKWLDRKEIVALTGARRSGKTTIMYIVIEKLLEHLPKENILFLKCDDERVRTETLIETARESHGELFDPNGRIYLFLDEVQELDNWDRSVKRLYDLHEDVKIFLTGSRLLKRELSTSLAGRFASFTIHPFSFREFLTCRGLELRGRAELLAARDAVKHHLRDYLEWGGFPEIILEERRDLKQELLRFYSDSILYRDVVQRVGIQRVDKVESLKSFLLANISNLLSYNKVAKILGVSPDTIASYLHAMEEAYYFFQVPIFSYSLKKQQINPRKIYCVDTGIRNAVGFRFSSDIGRLYENLVFLHLKRQYDRIYYWKSGGGEVDFLVMEGDRITRAIQVCYDLEGARAREEKALLLALEEFELAEGVIITGDLRDTWRVQGRTIRLIPLWEWLLVS